MSVTPTTAAVHLPTVVSEAALGYFEKALGLGLYCADYSGMVPAGGGIGAIKVPLLYEETAGDKTAGTALTWGANTDTSFTITPDQHKIVAKVIEDITQLRSSNDLFEAYTRSGGWGLAKAFESKVATVVQSSSTNDTTLTADNTLTDAEVLTAIATLAASNIDPRDCVFAMNPTLFKSVAALDTYKKANERGASESFQNQGALGSWYGMPVYLSNDFSAATTTGAQVGAIWHRDAVGFAFWRKMQAEVGRVIEHRGDGLVIESIYGVSVALDAGILNFLNP